ncbi:MAG: hypothetical protein HZC37_19200 [Burkholderiales bacterium]|nr:hypothetical protein [Burkholderiales bacterium]
MPRFAEVSHEEWIAAGESRVRSQFADLRHHIEAGVHPKLQFRILEQGPRIGADPARYEQRVKLLGITQRDVFERTFTADGRMVDTSVEGFNRGGSLSFRFSPERRGALDGTRVEITIRLPLPPLIGPLLRPLLEAQVRKEVVAAVAEDKHDIEVRGYRPPVAAAERGAGALGLAA